MCVRQETVQYFTESEEALARGLVQKGVRLNVAKVVILLANLKEASAAEIERGAGMRQSDVSVAIKYLASRELIRTRKGPSAGTGRPVKFIGLAKSLPEIIDQIQQEKNERVLRNLSRLRELNYFIS
jgi:predicted transcriptional regulator